MSVYDFRRQPVTPDPMSTPQGAAGLLPELYDQRATLQAKIERAETMARGKRQPKPEGDLAATLAIARIFADDLAAEIGKADALAEGDARDVHVRLALVSFMRLSNCMEEAARLRPRLMTGAVSLATLTGRLTRTTGTPA